MFDRIPYQKGQNTSTEKDDINQNQIFLNKKIGENTQSEETVIINEGLDDDYVISNSQNIRLNEKKVKEIVNSEKEEITPDIEEPVKIEENKNFIINKNKYQNKTAHKKSAIKQKLMWEEKNEKNKNDENTDELFKKAIEKAIRDFPPIEHDNNLSGRVTEVLYDKYVGKNMNKSKHLDIYSKFKDESIRQEREWNRTKDDAKKISDMIERQERYEELKHDKKLGRQRELKKKIKSVCVFIPNGKKNIQENMRTPSHFYSDQKKFIVKKVEYINKLAQNKIENEQKFKKVQMVSKKSEIIANNKNPNETLEQFCKRLAEEKLKNKKETLDTGDNKEIKKLTKKEMLDLTEKLHKEGKTFKINREKKEKELADKIKDDRNKKNFVLEKSTKVIFDKFVSEYDKIVNDLFGDKDIENNNNLNEKNNNYEININEYKTLLTNLGFIKCDNNENENKVELMNIINNSFYNYLNPKDDKIDTNKFLTFCLAALGIYKGKDEKVQDHSSKITPKLKPEEEKENGENQVNAEENKINTIPQKKQIRTSTEFIKLYLPNLDLDKYGYTEKECNLIKSEFFVFVLGISESWAKGLVKKKQERLDKLEETIKKNNLEETKKLENKLKKEEEIIGAYRKKIFDEEFPLSNDKDNKSNNILQKSFKVEDMYEILQKKKQRELDTLKAKKEEDINKECTFQPNSKIKKPINKKEVQKKIEKLYIEGKNSYIKKRQIETEPNVNNNEKDCTFKPVIKDYKGNYFENNPLKEDILYNIEVKKMEKLREEQGYTNKKIKKQMFFEIEPKSNKDNIDKRVAQKRGEKIINKVHNEFKNYGNFDDKGNQITVKIEVNLKNNKTELLIIQPDEDYLKVVDNFCSKYEINTDSKMRLIRTIKDKLRKN